MARTSDYPKPPNYPEKKPDLRMFALASGAAIGCPNCEIDGTINCHGRAFLPFHRRRRYHRRM